MLLGLRLELELRLALRFLGLDGVVHSLGGRLLVVCIVTWQAFGLIECLQSFLSLGSCGERGLWRLDRRESGRLRGDLDTLLVLIGLLLTLGLVLLCLELGFGSVGLGLLLGFEVSLVLNLLGTDGLAGFALLLQTFGLLDPGIFLRLFRGVLLVLGMMLRLLGCFLLSFNVLDRLSSVMLLLDLPFNLACLILLDFLELGSSVVRLGFFSILFGLLLPIGGGIFSGHLLSSLGLGFLGSLFSIARELAVFVGGLLVHDTEVACFELDSRVIRTQFVLTGCKLGLQGSEARQCLILGRLFKDWLLR